MANAFETGPRKPLGILGAKEAVEKEVVEEREDLGAQLTREELEREALEANDPVAFQESINRHTEGFLEHMQLVGNETAKSLEESNWEERMDAAFPPEETATKDVATNLREIAGKLDKPVPEFTDKNIGSHPYLALYSENMKGPHKAVFREYHITGAVHDDIRYVEDLLSIETLSAEQKTVLGDLLKALKTYASNDMPVAFREALSHRLKNGRSVTRVNKMLRIAGIASFGTAGLGVSAAVLASAIANKKLKVTDLLVPTIYITIATLLAFPEFTNGKHKNSVDQLRKVMSPEFKAAAKKIDGEAGDALITKITKDRVDIAALTTDTEREAFTQSATPNKDQQAKIRIFLDDESARLAFSPVKDVTDTIAQTYLGLFVSENMVKFYVPSKGTLKNIEGGTQVA